MNKNDVRYLATEKKIRDALFRLLSAKSIDRISTGKIIAEAGIHKSTFYSHYPDKYALLEGLETELVAILSPCLEKIFINMFSADYNTADLSGLYSELAATIFRYSREFSVLVNNSQYSNLPLRLSEKINEIWSTKGFSSPDNVYHSYLTNVIAFIMVGAIEKWVRRGCTDPIEIFDTLANATGSWIKGAYSLL